MRALPPNRKRRSEAGIALLIAIFVLLLISVVAIALIVSSNTESALAGNYRSSTSVYYAAVAGVEEARARLRTNNPNSFKNTAPAGFLPAPGTAFDKCTPSYVLNPLTGEAVTPWDPANPYYDAQFGLEFGAFCGGAAGPPSPSPSTSSVWNSNPLNGLPFPGPVYKWVRINGVTEQSLNLDTSPYDGIDNKLVYYDGTNLTDVNTSGQVQVLEITALAALPNGSRKIVQYLVTPAQITLPPFPAALGISGSPGNSPTFHAPASNAVYAIKGIDRDCNGNPTGQPPYVAMGLFGDYTGYSYAADLNSLVNGIPSNVSGTNPRNNYTGAAAAPDVEYLIAYPANLQTPSGLDAIVQAISQSADVTLPSGSTGSALTPLNMSSSNPLTIVVNGNLDITNWSHDGYGLLLVKGTFTYDPDTSWNGIILVIGQGIVNGSHMQYKWINGAMLVAKTRDAGGSLLTGRIGGGIVSFGDTMQGSGIAYSSCWIQKAQPISGYKILSFHEISQ